MQKSTLAFSFILLMSLVQAQPNNAKPGQRLIPKTATIYYQLGDKKLPIHVAEYGEASNNLVCINLHDNEGTSVDAAKKILSTTGGTLIRLDNRKQRVIRFRYHSVTYAFDPNRIFSREGIEQTLNDNHRSSEGAIEEIEKLAARLLDLFPKEVNCIVALHNNTDEAFSVKSYLPGRDLQDNAKAVFAAKGQDVDDIALTTDSLLYTKMADRGYNSIWQDNERAIRDGSLSVYCGERNLRYINIETQHGKVAQYMEMLGHLLAILTEDQPLPERLTEDSR
jgi:hypothetical protein